MKEPESAFEKFRQTLANSITLKLAIIGILLLLMNIPLHQVDGLIRERQNHLLTAKRDIQNSFGTNQTIIGPELTIPYEKKTYTALLNGKVKENVETFNAHFLPDVLEIEGNIDPKERNRGIYTVNVYEAGLKLTGNFDIPTHDIWNEEDIIIHWEKAYFTLGVEDQKNINDVSMFVNGKEYEITSEPSKSGIIHHGLHINYDLSESRDQMNFAINLNINGSNYLDFVPVGKETKVKLNSKWKDPSFYGSFPPLDGPTEVTEQGFNAEWKVFHLNRSIPQKYIGKLTDFTPYNFGVKLFESVDDYTKIERSIKYAMLFISLTFVTFFFIQIINKVKIHPFQFIIVGLALTVFYILLLSLSEHFGFDLAYLFAAIGIILQISLYVRAIFKSWKLGGLMVILLSTLYVFIYVIIQLATHSLLMGSIGLFIIIGVLMYLSRNIDWSLNKKLE